MGLVFTPVSFLNWSIVFLFEEDLVPILFSECFVWRRYGEEAMNKGRRMG